MNTIPCGYCSGGQTFYCDENGREESSLCVYCHGTTQMPCDENGKPDFRRILGPVISVSQWAKTAGVEFAAKWWENK